METLIVTIRDEEKLSQIEQVLRDMEGVEAVKRLRRPDEVSLMAQPALVEEWDSTEDQRWDSLL
ncbi:hypothetical protein [Spirosoma arcticum]